MNSNVTKHRPRPLSPHLQVYSWLISSTLSILHRLTGVITSLGLLAFVYWLMVLAYGGVDQYEDFSEFFRAPLGVAMLIGWSAALYYHLGNGIRHLCWDFGKGFELKNVTRSGITVLIFTVIATATTRSIILGYLKI